MVNDHKLLSKLFKENEVYEGKEIKLKVDYALAHDGSMPKIIKEYEDQRLDRTLPFGHLMHVTFDHCFPAATKEQRNMHFAIEGFCTNHKINIYNNGEGILHQVIADKFGEQLSDKVIVGVDGHVSTSAGLGAIPFSISPSEMIDVLVKGYFTFKAPSVLYVELQGKTKENKGKDIALEILGAFKLNGLKDKAVIITGEGIDGLSVSQNMTITNILGEASVRTTYYSNDTELLQHQIKPDLVIDISKVESLIALPGSPDNVEKISNVSIEKITEVFIGGCTNGRLEDIKEVVTILEGKLINRNVSLFVCPASKNIANEMDKLGYSSIIRNSGGVVLSPGCGACSGIHQGVLGDEDIAISTTVRNTYGRMGSKKAKIYLASPKVATFAAIRGKI
ncbi:hypothetical protein F8154_07170 [Alkaliphilus pronyensis]|uniref:Aconitase/3-isopropylmalate dehydratase large subunit alpha/beta/alpha domain-containing protein n=1 Tax=Alkaliphilus pronyensis TaxID=1482732 RepID=A0A6I0F8T4_9FIRM|nr:aconitase family protein [Alkaliphilus pronyensis]KAB3535214.1 hypothetical protein F8154_07170 [Alkaliphilus pronyensis]